MNATAPPLKCGETLALACADYKFGTLDPLRLEIVTVLQEHLLDDGLWIEVCGVMLRDNGSPARTRPYTLVRASAIGKARAATAGPDQGSGC